MLPPRSKYAAMPLDDNPSGAIASFRSLLLASTPRLGFIATLVIILVAQYVRSPWRNVPPGPKGFPILGNAFQLQNKGWMFGKECKRKFGSSNFYFYCRLYEPLDLP
jgi:hypothetical protein